MSVTIGNIMENRPKIQIFQQPKNALFDGLFVIPRPLHNSYMEKVSIVKWSQKSTTEVPFLAYPNILKIADFNAISKYLGMPKMALPSTKVHF